MNQNIIEKMRLVSTLLGAASVLAGERYFSANPSHWWLTGSGLLLLLTGVAIAVNGFNHAKKMSYQRELPTWKLTMLWQGLILFSFAMFFGYQKVLSMSSSSSSSTWLMFAQKLLLVCWLLPLVLGGFMGIGVEWAQMTNGRGQYAEPRRVMIAALDWLKVGILAVIIASVSFVAVKKNKTWDLSYLKTSAPSESTLKLIEGLQQDVEVALFFPTGNDVLVRAKQYCNGLNAKSSKLAINFYDAEINPNQAEKFKVNRNGYVVFKMGDQTERFDLGTTLTTARKNLKNLDAEFQKALMGVLEKKKVIYFTRGHGEFSWLGGDGSSQNKSMKLLEAYLRSVNFNMRFFGVSEGATNAVPADADVVIVMGGEQPFLTEEVAAIKNYVSRGGKLFVAFDVDASTETSLTQGRDVSKDPLVQWLKEVGISFETGILANASNFVVDSRTDADHWFLFSNVFTSHESVQTLARNEQRAAIISFKSGHLQTKQDLADWNVFDTVRSLSDSFVDENRDFLFNEGKEKREPRVIGAVAEQKNPSTELVETAKSGSGKGRVVAFADASAFSDRIIRNQANVVYFVDAIRWLVGNVKSAGVTTSEEDVMIRHSNKEDVAWFYGTVVLVPGLVLLAGLFATKRAKKGRREVGGERQESMKSGGQS